MEYFLPIAEVYVSLPLIFLLSLFVGVLSGLFGVGGGFLMTPFLIFMGIPPAYAVPNEANNILGTSISGSTTHYLKGTLDYKMGLMIVVGGTAGTLLGILTFTYFKDIGKINVVISLSYMYILAIIGTLMLVQGITEIDRARKKIVVKKIPLRRSIISPRGPNNEYRGGPGGPGTGFYGPKGGFSGNICSGKPLRLLRQKNCPRDHPGTLY